MFNKKEYQKNWQLKNKDYIKKHRRNYYLVHKDQHKEYTKNYYYIHQEKIKERARKWVLDNYQRKKENDKNYRITHKNEIRLCRKKNQRMRKLGGELTLQIIQRIYEENIKQYGTLTCYLCLKPIEFGKDTLEHKIPLIRGGTNEYKNLSIACQMCNLKKSIKTDEEYKKWLNELQLKIISET